jgi:tetratricopeptide (TPR) repeat protein
MEELSLPVPSRIQILTTKLSLARANGHKFEELRCLGYLGAAYAEAGDALEATQAITEALPILAELGDSLLLRQILVYLGEDLASQGKVAEAIPYLEQYFALVEPAGDMDLKAVRAAQLGRLYFELKKPLAAIPYLEKAAFWSYTLSHLDESSRLYNKAALAHAELGALTEAVSCLYRALALAQQSSNVLYQAQIYTNLAAVCAGLASEEDQGNYQVACKLAQAGTPEVSHPPLALCDLE